MWFFIRFQGCGDKQISCNLQCMYCCLGWSTSVTLHPRGLHALISWAFNWLLLGQCHFVMLQEQLLKYAASSSEHREREWLPLSYLELPKWRPLLVKSSHVRECKFLAQWREWIPRPQSRALFVYKILSSSSVGTIVPMLVESVTKVQKSGPRYPVSKQCWWSGLSAPPHQYCIQQNFKIKSYWRILKK